MAGLSKKGTEPCWTSALAAVRVGRLGSGGWSMMLGCPTLSSTGGDETPVAGGASGFLSSGGAVDTASFCGVPGLELGLLVRGESTYREIKKWLQLL